MTRLQALRKERGYTQIKMQMLTGIDQSDYSKLETGKRYYTYEQLRRIALALDTSMDYLAGLTDGRRPGAPSAGGSWTPRGTACARTAKGTSRTGRETHGSVS